jgi:FtsH-binding integral membrane protein
MATGYSSTALSEKRQGSVPPNQRMHQSGRASFDWYRAVPSSRSRPSPQSSPKALMASNVAAPGLQAAERRFYSSMAVAILLTALLGFARTYFLRPLLPASAQSGLTPLIHLHAILFTSWVMFFLLQVRLIAHRRVDLHRKLGIGGALLATLMTVVGVMTALHGVLRGVAPFGMEPRRFLVVPLAAIGLFVLMTAAALVFRRDPQRHKRFMLLGTIALLPPAIARWAVLLGVGPLLILAVSMLFIVPMAVWDWRTRHRLHPVTLWGGLLLLLSGPARLAFAQTDVWARIADRLTALVQ